MKPKKGDERKCIRGHDAIVGYDCVECRKIHNKICKKKNKEQYIKYYQKWYAKTKNDPEHIARRKANRAAYRKRARELRIASDKKNQPPMVESKKIDMNKINSAIKRFSLEKVEAPPEKIEIWDKRDEYGVIRRKHV